MRFTCTVEVRLPRKQTVELWSNPEHLSEWQDGFISLEHLSGTPGEAGAKSQMVYQIGKRRIELVETIVTNDLPDWFIGTYDTEAMTNTMINRFVSVEGGTRWDAEIEYTRFGSIMPRIMAWVMPGMFRKQTQKWLDQFKIFAESVNQENQGTTNGHR
jgi:hypothetical protein